MSSRFSRGRAYARDGRVLSLDVRKGLVAASVQGSRRHPYSVEIRINPLSDDQWKRVAEVLASQAGFLASILLGVLPEEVDKVLTLEDIYLIPRSSLEVRASCSCPDWADPCKHVVAVYYVLVDLLGRDPRLLFTLRGKTFDEVMADIRVQRARKAPREPALRNPELENSGDSMAQRVTSQFACSLSKDSAFRHLDVVTEDAAISRRPSSKVPGFTGSPNKIEDFIASLPASYIQFWTVSAGYSLPPAMQSSTASNEISRPQITGAGVTSLPPLPFRDEDSVIRKTLEQIYELASRKAREMKWQ